MNKALLLLTILTASEGFAQEWAPIGAKWHYTHSGSSFAVFECIGDTIIDGISCRKIQKSKSYSNFGNRPLAEFTYYSNDSVYYYDTNYPGFYLLYDFNASPGDFWYYRFIGNSYAGDIDSIKTTVDSIDFVNINSYLLKRLFVHYDTAGFEDAEFCSWLLCDRASSIIQFLGDTLNMFNTFTMDETIFDTYYPSGLRCYDDTIIGHYETGIVDSCNYVNVLSTTESNPVQSKIFPNPTTGTLFVDGKFEGYSILSTDGRIIESKMSLIDDRITIDFSNLENGIYFLQLERNGDGRITQKIIKQ